MSDCRPASGRGGWGARRRWPVRRRARASSLASSTAARSSISAMSPSRRGSPTGPRAPQGGPRWRGSSWVATRPPRIAALSRSRPSSRSWPRLAERRRRSCGVSLSACRSRTASRPASVAAAAGAPAPAVGARGRAEAEARPRLRAAGWLRRRPRWIGSSVARTSPRRASSSIALLRRAPRCAASTDPRSRRVKRAVNGAAEAAGSAGSVPAPIAAGSVSCDGENSVRQRLADPVRLARPLAG